MDKPESEDEEAAEAPAEAVEAETEEAPVEE